ncbi:alpha/beta-type small acid-soluble spore protein [Sporosarcina sp. HYO08]|uniref:alpha/beta-type small acid-soluble spore protein n=1 Tax=Sporosarcina sp. HYO08 TaxID=1759557 RepID=UPI00079510E2|nr:alpha/beta-type small acid-soluble spore protein [Sporosarcina sp. HYO08]KXH81679.1 hypothetical protein AU377_05255 [Sporosarcina sp. HYO08]
MTQNDQYNGRYRSSEWHAAMNRLKVEVFNAQGNDVDDNKKVEIAQELGIPLKKGYNGELKAKQAGNIGGKMVKKMVGMAQTQLKKK